MKGPSLLGQRYGKLSSKVFMTTLGDDEFRRAVDISLLVNDMSLYENMSQGTFSVNLNITDSTGVLENFPLTGHELFKISLEHMLKIDDEDPKWECTFRIMNIDGFNPSATAKEYLFYRLTLVSLEGFRNGITQISRFVNGQIGRKVSQILKNDLGTKKTINASPTAPVSVALTWQSPYDAIRTLATETPPSLVNSENPERDFYVFWEDRDSFNFESLRTLELREPIFDFQYTDGNLAEQENAGESCKAIISYQIDRGYNIGAAINSGTYYANTLEIDNQGNVIGKPKIWSNSEPYATQLERLKKDETTGHTTDLHTLGNMRRIVPHKPGINLSEKVGFINSYNAVQLSFIVHGDLAIRPGLMCVVNIRTYASIDDSNRSEPIWQHISGFYMIVGVKHMVMGTNEQNYNCTIQAYKIPDSRINKDVLTNPDFNSAIDK